VSCRPGIKHCKKVCCKCRGWCYTQDRPVWPHCIFTNSFETTRLPGHFDLLPLQGQKVKGQLVADVLNSQHAGTGATWRIKTKILSTCRGRKHILCRHVQASDPYFQGEVLSDPTVSLQTASWPPGCQGTSIYYHSTVLPIICVHRLRL